MKIEQLQLEFLDFFDTILMNKHSEIDKAIIARQSILINDRYITLTEAEQLGAFLSSGEINEEICQNQQITFDERVDLSHYQLETQYFSFRERLILSAAIFVASNQLIEKYITTLENLMTERVKINQILHHQSLSDEERTYHRNLLKKINDDINHESDQLENDYPNFQAVLQSIPFLVIASIDKKELKEYLPKSSGKIRLKEFVMVPREETSSEDAREFLLLAEQYITSNDWQSYAYPKTVIQQLKEIDEAKQDADYIGHKIKFLEIGQHKANSNSYLSFSSNASYDYFKFFKSDNIYVAEDVVKHEFTKKIKP